MPSLVCNINEHAAKDPLLDLDNDYTNLEALAVAKGFTMKDTKVYGTT